MHSNGFILSVVRHFKFYMNKFFFFGGLILCCLLLACKKNKENNSLVVGSWKWERTYMGVDGSVIKPGSDETFILIFKSNGSYTYTKNSVVLRSGRYSVKKFEP